MADTASQTVSAAPAAQHPVLKLVKERFAGQGLKAAEFRGQTTIVAPREKVRDLLKFLKEDPRCAFDMCCDVVGVDYLNYPGAEGRFGVVYNLVNTHNHGRIFVKVLLDPTMDTLGTADDPGLHMPSAREFWPGCDWTEREVFDMFGIRFDGHPDLRRILTWEAFPAHPLRKDYPLTGRGERESYNIINRDSA